MMRHRPISPSFGGDIDHLLHQIMALLNDAELAPLFSEAALAEAPIGGF